MRLKASSESGEPRACVMLKMLEVRSEFSGVKNKAIQELQAELRY